jgi:hypothetical protein
MKLAFIYLVFVLTMTFNLSGQSISSSYSKSWNKEISLFYQDGQVLTIPTMITKVKLKTYFQSLGFTIQETKSLVIEKGTDIIFTKANKEYKFLFPDSWKGQFSYVWADIKVDYSSTLCYNIFVTQKEDFRNQLNLMYISDKIPNNNFKQDKGGESFMWLLTFKDPKIIQVLATLRFTVPQGASLGGWGQRYEIFIKNAPIDKLLSNEEFFKRMNEQVLGTQPPEVKSSEPEPQPVSNPKSEKQEFLAFFNKFVNSINPSISKKDLISLIKFPLEVKHADVTLTYDSKKLTKTTELLFKPSICGQFFIQENNKFDSFKADPSWNSFGVKTNNTIFTITVQLQDEFWSYFTIFVSKINNEFKIITIETD